MAEIHSTGIAELTENYSFLYKPRIANNWLMKLAKYENNLYYLPKKEREALEELRIAEKEVDSVANAIIRRINASKGMV